MALSCTSTKPSKNDVQKIISECVSGWEAKKAFYRSYYLYYEVASFNIDNIEIINKTPEVYTVYFNAVLRATKETRTFTFYNDLTIKQNILSSEKILNEGDKLTVKGSLDMQYKNDKWVYSSLSFKNE